MPTQGCSQEDFAHSLLWAFLAQLCLSCHGEELIQACPLSEVAWWASLRSALLGQEVAQDQICSLLCV